jgi:SPOR domain
MPTMVTFRAGRLALLAAVAALGAGCSREQQDWRSAEAADTTEAWTRFIEQHPESELVSQARARMAQLTEQRDWQHATSIATAEAYREFLSSHPSGRLSEEARIRIEAFALGSAPRIEPQTPEEAAASRAAAEVRGVPALQLATAAPPPQPPAGSEGSVAVPAEATDAAVPVTVPAAATAVAMPVAVPTPATGGAAGGGYGVQLGAFSSEASADREWQRLQGRFGAELGGLSPRIVPSGTDSAQLYRLQAPAAGEAQARAICDSLKQQAQPCVPVLPR